MKRLLFLSALLVCFSSFGQDDRDEIDEALKIIFEKMLDAVGGIEDGDMYQGEYTRYYEKGEVIKILNFKDGVLIEN